MELSTQTHFSQGWNTRLLNDVASLGTNTIRDAVPWNLVESRAGKYNFDHRGAAWVDKALAAGFDVVLVFNPANPNYDNGNTVYTAAGRAAYADFIVATLKAFPGISAIEIGNEFNTNNFVKGPIARASKDLRDEYYAKIVDAVDSALTKAGINVEVIGASTHSIPVDYFAALEGSGALDHVDSISIHPYSTEPEQFAAQLAVLRDKIGWDIDIHVTEFGDKFEDLSEAPAFLAKMVAVMAEAGVASANWYAFARQSFFPNMELWDPKRDVATPAGVTFKLLEAMLADNAQVERVPVDSHTYFFTFGENAAILWGETRGLALSAGVTAYDLAGRRINDLAALSPDTPIILRSANGHLAEGVTFEGSALLADSYHDFDLTGGAGPWTYFAENGLGKVYELATMGGGHTAGEPWTPYIGVEFLRPFQISANNVTPVDFSGNKARPTTEFDTVERFTAQADGTVTIRGHWDVSDLTKDGVLLIIEVNGKAAFSKVIYDVKSGHVFDLELTDIVLKAGDTIDFHIDSRANAKGDVTERRIQIFDQELLKLLGSGGDPIPPSDGGGSGTPEPTGPSGGDSGSTAPLKLKGNSSDNILIGLGGNDEIKGRGGNDQLLGGDGRDVLYGDGGNDILNGGKGNDTLTGGRGSDIFVFDADFGNDTIADFKAGDRIDLSAFEQIHSFADLNITFSAKRAVITIEDNKIILTGVSEADLDASDFIL